MMFYTSAREYFMIVHLIRSFVQYISRGYRSRMGHLIHNYTLDGIEQKLKKKNESNIRGHTVIEPPPLTVTSFTSPAHKQHSHSPELPKHLPNRIQF